MRRLEGLFMKEEMSQEGKDLTARRQMRSNFLYKGPFADKILIVDDVITTGSTLKGAFEAVSGHAKRIKVLSLAYKNITLHY